MPHILDKEVCMTISAGNILSGTVASVIQGAINTEVMLALNGGNSITAVITNESRCLLNVTVGSEAYAMIQASLVMLVKGPHNLKFSTRNSLYGAVKVMNSGDINTEVVVELKDGTAVSAMISSASVQSMELSVGDAVTALFKASSVILAVRA
jgi:molybdate transport system regulatory protein